MSASAAAAKPSAAVHALVLVHFILCPFALGCGRQNAEAEAKSARAPSAEQAPAAVSSAPVSNPNGTWRGPGRLGDGFSAPDSALYDPDQDVYFVSNGNEEPTAKDDNGYISRVPAAAGALQARWIDGALPEVELNAPKGMAIVGDELWVADIDVVRRFDRKTGAPRGSIAIPGSVFLSDIAAAPDGSVYVSDTAVAVDGSGPHATGKDAIYRLRGDASPEPVIAGADLHQPKGLAVVDGALWAVSFASNELYRVDGGKKADVISLPSGSLDGLLRLADGTLLAASWDARGIYRGSTGGPFELIVEDVGSPADIGFDTKRSLLLIPEPMENEVSVYPLSPRREVR